MRYLFAVIVLLCCSVAVLAQQFYISVLGDQPLQTLKVGAGGFMTRADVNPTDGTVYARNDTYGAYKWNGSTWTQVVTTSTMLGTMIGWQGSGTTQVYKGSYTVFEISSAPTPSSTVYMALSGTQSDTNSDGNILKSTDGAATWVNTNFNSSCLNACGLSGSNTVTGRTDGPKMAISNADANTVITGTNNAGVWITNDGGVTWTAIATIPTVSEYAIVFDPSDSTGNTAYVCANTSKVWVSINARSGASATWAATSGSPGTTAPNTCGIIKMAARTGIVLLTDGANGAGGSLWEYVAGSWVKNPGSLTGAWHTITVDPTSCTVSIATCTVLLGGANGASLTISTGLSGWIAFGAGRSCTNDVQWLCTTPEFSMSSGGMEYDLTGSTVWFAEGIGMWNGSPAGVTFNWNAKSQGIENLVSFGNIIAPNGAAIIAVEDRGATLVPTPYTYTSAGNAGMFTIGQTRSITNSSAVDYASNNSSFMVAQMGPDSGGTFDFSAYTTNGGGSWTPFNFGWSTTVVASSAIADNGGGLIRITVPTTVGLTTWSNGAGSLICALGQNPIALSVTSSPLTNTIANSCFPATVIDATHVDLQNSTFSVANQSPNISKFLLYVPAFPAASRNGSWLIQAIAGSGVTTITLNSGYGTPPPNGSAVHVVNSGCCDGWWITTGLSGSAINLQGSGTPSAPCASGCTGEVDWVTTSGGGFAVATSTNMIRLPGQDEYPLCTTDRQNWTDIGPLLLQSPHYSTVTAASYDGGTGKVTFTTAAAVNITTVSGSSSTHFQVMGATPSAYNGVYNATGGSGSTVIATALAGDPGAYVSGGTLVPGGFGNHGTGWAAAVFNSQHLVAADRVIPNKFYLYNFAVAGIWQVTNCTPDNGGSPVSTVTPNTGYALSSGTNSMLKTVPGEAAHFFFESGQSGSAGSNHPTANRLYRSCDGGTNMVAVSGMWEPWGVGFGKNAPGSAYGSAEYVWGWYNGPGGSQGGKFSLWRSTDDPNHGVGGIGTNTPCITAGQTWTDVLLSASSPLPLGWANLAISQMDITGSLTIYGQIFSRQNNGAVYGVFNYLFNRDLDPAANDNTPMFLNQAA